MLYQLSYFPNERCAGKYIKYAPAMSTQQALA